MTGFVADLLASAVASIAWQPLARGIWLGLGAAIPIGPVNIEIARRALRHGFLAGAALGFGAVTVDVVYAVLSTFSFVAILNRPAVLLPIAALGTLLLTYLGLQCLRAAHKAWKVDPFDVIDSAEALANDADKAADTRRVPSVTAHGVCLLPSYLTGVLMTLLNPMTLLFWFVAVPAMGAGSAGGSTSQAAGSELPMMCVGVFVGTVSWVLGFSTLLAIASRAAGHRHERRRKWLALADAVGGIALIGFALLSALGFWRRLGAVL